MHILFVTTYYRPHTGGLEILTEQLADELQRRGHEVSVLTSIAPGDRAGPDRLNGTNVWRNDVHGAVARRDYAAILREQRDSLEVVADLQPDVVHAHDAMPWTWLYLRATRGRRPPVVQTLHNVLEGQYEFTGPGLTGLQTVLREADWVTGVSPDVVDDLRRAEPSIADRLSLVVNGIRPPTEAVEQVRDGPCRLVCVGRLVPQKGFDHAVRATATLAAQGHDVRLSILGDGPLRGPLVKLASELGIADHVDLVGEVPHDRVAAYLRDATIVVMPSRFEGLPLVALEAASMGRPIVGTAAPGLSQAVVDGTTGVLVHDDGDLAAAIEGLIVDRDRARALGVAARVRVEELFSLSACVDGYLDVYGRVV